VQTISSLDLGAESHKFLNAVREGSRKTYQPGLTRFQEFLIEAQKHIRGETNIDFLSAENTRELFSNVVTIRDFLKQILADRRLDPLSQQFTDREILKFFAKWLLSREYTAKTIWTYIGAIQRLGAYYGITIETTYLGMPPANAASKKFPWELDTVAKFIKSMADEPVYQTMAVTIFQSGLGLSDLLALDYDSIKADFEANITPFCLDLVRLKTNVPHMTFVGSFGASLIRESIGSRKMEEDKTKLFDVTARSVEKYFLRKAVEVLGTIEGTNPMRPHSLRSAFDTLMTDDGCPESYVEFFMGHRLKDIKKIYKSKTVEGWRKIYSQHEKAVAFKL
jgi:integrase